MGAYASREAKWEVFLKQRSYPRAGIPRPTGVKDDQSWWYTHQRLRRALGFYRALIRHENLFTWLEPGVARGTGNRGEGSPHDLPVGGRA